MNELLAFPLLGALFVFFVLTPALTVCSSGALAWRRRRTRHLREFADSTTWLLLVLPVLGPVIWLGGAALGQFLFARAIPCLREHDLAGICLEPAVFATFTAGIVVALLARKVHRHDHVALDGNHALTRRLDAICSADALLAVARRRIVIIADGDDVLHTSGWLRPRIELHADLAARLDDEALRAALLHELEHARTRDPLRFGVAQVCLALNPFARMLRADHDRWRLAREVDCDAHAVEDGASPLALAAALVTAARPRASRVTALATAHLCRTSLEQLELRVALLMHAPPTRRGRSVGLLLLVVACALVMLFVGDAPLDHLHVWTEASVDQVLPLH